jgi:hypothetical protein
MADLKVHEDGTVECWMDDLINEIITLSNAIRKLNRDSGNDICDFYPIDVTAKRIEENAQSVLWITEQLPSHCLEEICKITDDEA